LAAEFAPLKRARAILDAGARKVIIGSSLLDDGKINTQYAAALAGAVGTAALVFAVDSRGGRVAIEGWRKQTALTAFEMIRTLESFCENFSLYPHRLRRFDGRHSHGGCKRDPAGNNAPFGGRRLASRPRRKLMPSTLWAWTPWSEWQLYSGRLSA